MPTKQSYFPSLDGLRGVAILIVVFHHNFRFTDYFLYGWLGVDLFFVLSGFLITNVLINTINNPGFLIKFYTRRILRIFPIYYLTLTICLLVLPYFKSLEVNLSYYTYHQIWFWVYFQNWLFIFKPTFGTNIILHFWSLAVEEQFYLLWPLSILLIKKPKPLLFIAISMLLLIGVSRIILWNLHIENLAYSSFFTFTRIDGICVGCILSLIFTQDKFFLRKKIIWIFSILSFINLLFYFFIKRKAPQTPYFAFVGYTTFSILFGLLVYEGVLGKIRVLNIILTNAWLRFFGKISYGLYVFHWPIYVLLFNPVKQFFHLQINFSNSQSNIVSAFTIILLSIFISTLSYRYFESYFLKLKNKFA